MVMRHRHHHITRSVFCGVTAAMAAMLLLEFLAAIAALALIAVVLVCLYGLGRQIYRRHH